jgi:hypothetical protein
MLHHLILTCTSSGLATILLFLRTTGSMESSADKTVCSAWAKKYKTTLEGMRGLSVRARKVEPPRKRRGSAGVRDGGRGRGGSSAQPTADAAREEGKDN